MDRPVRAACKKLLSLFGECVSQKPCVTKKESNAKYQAKLKSDPVQYELFKQSEAERLKKYRAGLTED